MSRSRFEKLLLSRLPDLFLVFHGYPLQNCTPDSSRPGRSRIVALLGLLLPPALR